MADTETDREHLLRITAERFDERAARAMSALLPPEGHVALARQNDMVARFDAVDRRFEAVDRRLDRLDSRMDRLEGALREQTRFYVTCLFASHAIATGIVGLLVGLS